MSRLRRARAKKSSSCSAVRAAGWPPSVRKSISIGGTAGIESDSGLERAQIGQDHAGVRVHVLDLVALRDHPVGIDEVAVPLGELDLLGPGVARLVRDADLLVEVRQQPEREVE